MRRVQGVTGAEAVLATNAEDRAGARGWTALLGGSPDLAGADLADLAAWAGRIADLLSPALADYLLAPIQRKTGPLIAPERAAKSWLYSRFLRQRQIEAVRLVQRSGARFICMKGFAFAHMIYGRPEARIIGDVDLLLDAEDLGKAAAALARSGYSALPIPSRFGFISDSSFLPIVSADGQVAIDLHVAPDAWPASRSLSAAAVFGRATAFAADELELRAPAPEHAFFLLVTNMAKDRFGPEGVRKIVDATRLAAAHRGLDWDAVATLARRGGYRGALAAFLRLTELLGGETGAPARLSRGGPWAEREIRRVAASYRKSEVPRLAIRGKWRREFLLGPDPLSVLRINLKRLRGLVRPGTGLPPGIPERR
jgi:hypothetical protein